ERIAKRQLVDSRFIYVSGDGIKPRTAVLWSTEAGVPFAAAIDDRGNRAQRLHVVDHGRAAVQPDDSRKGRLDARIPALTFERLHQSGFFAAFIRARTRMCAQLESEAGAQNILA